MMVFENRAFAGKVSPRRPKAGINRGNNVEVIFPHQAYQGVRLF
jgi:hypothetical protein